MLLHITTRPTPMLLPTRKGYPHTQGQATTITPTSPTYMLNSMAVIEKTPLKGLLPRVTTRLRQHWLKNLCVQTSNVHLHALQFGGFHLFWKDIRHCFHVI